MSTEIGVALVDADNAVDAIIEVARRFPWGGMPAVRFVKGSNASLAFTCFAPTTCTIELPSVGSGRSLEAFEHVWDELETRNIRYTLHWGQILRPAPARMKAVYGTRWDDWIGARRALLSAAGRRTFANGMLVGCGLD
jgi:hypothetical protein